MVRICLPLSTIILALTGTVQAQAQDGAYVAVAGGIAQVRDTKVRYYDVGGTFGGTGSSDNAETQIELKRAAEFRGAIGYDFGMIRADVEVAYARNQARAATISAVNGQAVTLDPGDVADVCAYLEVTNCSANGSRIRFGGGSKIRTLSALANAWVDVPLGTVMTPYLGGGVGVMGFEMDGEGTGKFAWQLGAGVALKVGGPVAVTLDYRHREVGGKDFPWDARSGFEVGRIRTDSLAAGMRLKF